MKKSCVHEWKMLMNSFCSIKHNTALPTLLNLCFCRQKKSLDHRQRTREQQKANGTYGFTLAAHITAEHADKRITKYY